MLASKAPNRIRELRLARDITQEQLTFRAGVSLSSVKNIEVGRTKPTLADARRRPQAARALDLPVETVFPEDGRDAA